MACLSPVITHRGQTLGCDALRQTGLAQNLFFFFFFYEQRGGNTLTFAQLNCTNRAVLIPGEC